MALILKWSKYAFDFDKRTHVMGVLNVTPDSFSDGGRYYGLEKAVRHGVTMAEEGADIIDIGGESTRPFSEKVSVSEEMERVIPVIEALKKEIPIPISIDTYKSEIAAEALKAGASIINDISALRFDPEMPHLAKEAGVPVILMHMQGSPENMQKSPSYTDLIQEILDFLGEARDRALQAGIEKDKIILDPGIGFGKTFDDNLIIIRELSRFRNLGRPVLLGSSNKAFIGKVLEKEAHERDTGTMATVAAGIMNGAHLVRVHNVKMAVETARIIDAIKRGKVQD